MAEDKSEEKKKDSEEVDKGENKADIIDVDMEPKGVEVTKPAGKPAEKKMPRPEKQQKASESKAMPQPKAPRLNEETDKALKKLEKATGAKEQAAWLNPDDMASRTPTRNMSGLAAKDSSPRSYPILALGTCN